ncbi:DUF4105 domain-containing protein [Salinimonas sp. HHU 13199]|uniref:DUF4105 domain-containing protein n=1 Tax=Salinimonas profundi TaxID=2729140 RepID=A0ABR8LNJ3_9ALTE|nr:DUF4105 domain-containing protein [Salinimonas profundi]MBD3585665.1 DUF4105 domain-containing protein [Salinimonas profundi]
MSHKGSLLASFLYCIVVIFPTASLASMPEKSQLIRQLDAGQAAESVVWQTLLQLKDKAPLNPNYRGYLSQPVSAEAELIATVDLIYSSAQRACHYPARKQFIESFLNLPPGSLSPERCAEYEEFRRSVPTDEAYLVFAAENVTSASSMMGHIMLRFDGRNDENINVQHGVTFFTELNSLNIPLLLYDTLIKGKPGIFQVAPYAPFQQHYRQTEQRNVWEYTLDLNKSDKSLIAGMIWELGQFSPDYFFHTYNCATVTQLLLTLARPSHLSEMDVIVTPADVVRFALTQDLVAKTRLLPSHKWKAQSLNEIIGENSAQNIRQHLEAGNSNDLTFSASSDSFMQYEFATSLNRLLRQRKHIDNIRYQANIRHLQSEGAKFRHMALDVSDYKNPVNTSKEALLAAGVENYDGAQSLLFRFFPVASDIDSDNRNYSGETALSLADISLRYTPQNNALHLDRLLLYNMTSRVPYHDVFGNMSTGLKVGLDRVFDDHLKRNLVLQTELSGGITLPLSTSGGVFAESGLGVTADEDRVQVYLEPRIGGFFYLRHNTKVRFEGIWSLNKYAGSNVGRIDAHITHYLDNTWSVNARLSKLLADENEMLTTINLRYRF